MTDNTTTVKPATTPEELAALYRSRNGARPSPVALGDAFLACRRELGISQQELARRTGITPGVIHHHESVTFLPEPYKTHTATGKLRFKEARTLADLGWYHRRNSDRAAYIETDPRFEEIAALFISDRLSSVWVEKIVGVAHDDPAATVDDIVQRVISKAPRKPRGYVDTSQPPRQAIEASTATVRDHILALAGEVEAWGMAKHCEVERMPVLAAARLLDQRLHAAVLAASTGNGHADASTGTNGVVNRRLALLLEEPRKVLEGQEGLAI